MKITSMNHIGSKLNNIGKVESAHCQLDQVQRLERYLLHWTPNNLVFGT